MNQRVRMVVDGAIAGLIGAFVIALWYLIFDAAGGQPLGSLARWPPRCSAPPVARVPARA